MLVVIGLLVDDVEVEVKDIDVIRVLSIELLVDDIEVEVKDVDAIRVLSTIVEVSISIVLVVL
jgi:hypothetical protein